MSNITGKSESGVLRDFLVNAPEVTVFMTCCAMVNELRALERAFRVGEIAESPFLERYGRVLGQLSGAVAATERFDLVLPVTEERQFSSSFWRWYNWWNDYFKTLTPMQIGEIGRLARERVPDVDERRPDGRWWEYTDTPGFTLMVEAQ